MPQSCSPQILLPPGIFDSLTKKKRKTSEADGYTQHQNNEGEWKIAGCD